MTPTTALAVRRNLLASRGMAETPGMRFVMSEIGERLASGASIPDTMRVEVASADDVAALFRSMRFRAFDTSALSMLPDAQREIQVRPTPTALLPLVTIVPVGYEMQIPTVPEAFQLEDAAAVPDATNLPGLDDSPDVASFDVAYLEAMRVGRIIPLPLQVLQDSGQAEVIVDRLITQNYRRALEGYIAVGDFSPALVGITNTFGVVHTSAGGTPIDDLADAVEAVVAGGFYGPHAVVGAPTTLKALFTKKDTTGNYLRRDLALPTVSAWVPAPAMPSGTVVVCDPAEVLLYLVGDFIISISQGYADFFSRALAAVKGEQRAAIWIRNPGAFRVVDSIS